MGVVALERLEIGSFVAEYIGTVMSTADGRAQEEQYMDRISSGVTEVSFLFSAS